MINDNTKGNNKGFTLVEIIVVLVILAILAAISIPALTGFINRGKEAQYISAANYATKAATAAYVEMYAQTGRSFSITRISYSSNKPYRTTNTFAFDGATGNDRANGEKYVGFLNKYYDDKDAGMYLTGGIVSGYHTTIRFKNGQICDGTKFYFRNYDWQQKAGTKFVEAERQNGTWNIIFH